MPEASAVLNGNTKFMRAGMVDVPFNCRGTSLLPDFFLPDCNLQLVASVALTVYNTNQRLFFNVLNS